MRSWMRLLGLVGPLGGCFVDPGSATGGVAGSTSAGTGASSTSDGPVATGTDATSGGPEPTSTAATSTGEVSTIDATGAIGTTSTSATATTGASGTTGDVEASTGGTSGGAVELPVPGCVPLFYTDFSEDPTVVLNFSGSWAWNKNQGTLTVMTDKGATLASTMEGWADATAYTRVRVSSGFATLRLRSNEAWQGISYYYASINPVEDLLLGRVLAGQASALDDAPISIEPETWYTLSLRVHGTGLQAGVDGQATAMAQDDNLMIGTASIGGFGPGLAEFDWLLVCEN